MMGFRIPANFRLPFLSRNPAEIWARWHISLTSWLRDYLYISLGGNRRGKGRTYWNLFITMSLCGFWHGAGWRYVLWGVGSGIWLAIHRFISSELKWPRVPAFVGIFFTFHIWSLICVFFRTGSFEHAMISFRQLLDFSQPIYAVEPLVYVFLPLSFLSHFLGASKGLKRVCEDTFFGIKAVWYAFVAIAIYLTVYEPVDFIYFQF